MTGIVLPNREKFDDFGKLRNGLQHFGPNPVIESDTETLKFIFEVIDPFINDCWKLYAIDFDEDSERYIYLVAALVHREIKFLVSREAAETFGDWDVDWTSVSDKYRTEMHSRVEVALNAISNKQD